MRRVYRGQGAWGGVCILRTIGSFYEITSCRKFAGVALSNDEWTLLEVFGGKLRRVRDDAGLTQGELAERVGLQLRTVQKWEAGKINVPMVTLYRIQRALGCRWEELLEK
jgi:DNA-binding XRE family transcriptional regulator